jgi:hypothetical protein
LPFELYHQNLGFFMRHFSLYIFEFQGSFDTEGKRCL